MTIPAFLFGFLISTLYGAAFHLWRGGGAGRLLFCLVLGWAGFWLGHFLGAQLGIKLLNLGPLNFGLATLFSLLFLSVGHRLSLVEVKRV